MNRRIVQSLIVVATLIALLAGQVPNTGAETANLGARRSNRTYTSPTYGYSVSWDRTWDITDESSEDGYDLLMLDNGSGMVAFEGAPFDGDAFDCLTVMESTLEQLDGVRDVTPAEDAETGEPIADGDDENAWEVLILSTGSGREATSYFAYVSCQSLVPEEAVLAVTQIAPAEAFGDQIEALQELLQGLELSDDEEDDPGPGRRPRSRNGLDGAVETAAADLDAFWTEELDDTRIDHDAYDSPEIVLFDERVTTDCKPRVVRTGNGPFYCQSNETLYLDVPVMEQIAEEYGEIAVVLAMAHEWGHHVQFHFDLEADFGIDNAMELELMADCLAGLWLAQSAEDIGENDLVAVVTLYVELLGDPEEVPETDPGRHGSGTLRTHWFLTGYYQGDASGLGACAIDA
jgi:predicted metalloprotease